MADMVKKDERQGEVAMADANATAERLEAASQPEADTKKSEAVGPAKPARPARPAKPRSAFIRAENEDDDGYDPFSDRPARPEPLFERDPWG